MLLSFGDDFNHAISHSYRGRTERLTCSKRSSSLLRKVKFFAVSNQRYSGGNTTTSNKNFTLLSVTKAILKTTKHLSVFSLLSQINPTVQVLVESTSPSAKQTGSYKIPDMSVVGKFGSTRCLVQEGKPSRNGGSEVFRNQWNLVESAKSNEIF